MINKTLYIKEKEEQAYWDRLNKQAEDYGGDDSWRNNSKMARNANERNKERVLDAQKKMRDYIEAKQGGAFKKREQMFK